MEDHRKAETVEQSQKNPKVKTKEAAMCDTILEELKSLRSDLTSQIKKISDDFAILRSETNARLAKIESIMSKVDEIDNLKPKVQKLEEDVGDTRKPLSTLEETKKRLQEQTERGKKKWNVWKDIPEISTFVYSVLLKKKVKIVYQLFKISSHFLVFEMLEEKWKMPTAQVKNVMENLGILSLNCTADLSNEICFKSPKARKVKMHSAELDSWKIILTMILRQGRKLS